ncbi:MAG: potassium channel family protein [Xanthobacteraceae bacterium]
MGGARLERAMEVVRNVAELDHLWHADNMQTCAPHVQQPNDQSAGAQQRREDKGAQNARAAPMAFPHDLIAVRSRGLAGRTTAGDHGISGGRMHGQIAIGVATTLATIAVHAGIMAAVSWAVHGTSLATQAARAHLRVMLVMMATVSVLMVAHLVEIAIWGLVYAAIDAVPQKLDAYYFAFVNYTTLGYGDVLPVAYWRLLGPMAAMNGILLFGWSSAVIYDVLRTFSLADSARRPAN